jgi:hypothetical protein
LRRLRLRFRQVLSPTQQRQRAQRPWIRPCLSNQRHRAHSFSNSTGVVGSATAGSATLPPSHAGSRHLRVQVHPWQKRAKTIKKKPKRTPGHQATF